MEDKPAAFAALLLNGDELGALSFLENEERNMATVFQEIITKAMEHIGFLWQNNEITVADEHLATAICDFVLSQYAFTYRPEGKPMDKRIMFLCPEHEHHLLGTKMAAAICTELNWEVRTLGSNLPLEYALSFADKWQPHVIGLSAALSYRLPELIRYIEQLTNLAHRPQIIVGGRLSGLYDLNEYCQGNTMILQDLYQLKGWMEQLDTGVIADGIR